MKILTDDHWDVLMGQMDYLRHQIDHERERIKELERQVSSLLDRILIQQGQLPMDMNTVKIVQTEEQNNKDLFEQLTVDEVGEDRKDERDEREKPDVV